MSQDEVAGGFLGCIPGVGQSLQAAELWLVESGAITFWLAVSSAGVTGSGWALLLLRGATGESSSDEGVGAARAVVGAALESGSDFSGSKYSLVVSVLVRPSRCETTIVRVRISKMAAIGCHSWWSNTCWRCWPVCLDVDVLVRGAGLDTYRPGVCSWCSGWWAANLTSW